MNWFDSGVATIAAGVEQAWQLLVEQDRASDRNFDWSTANVEYKPRDREDIVVIALSMVIGIEIFVLMRLLHIPAPVIYVAP